MPAGVGPVSGTKFFTGPAGSPPTSPDQWIEVGDISNLGDLALQFAQIAVESLGSGDTYQLKGQRSLPNFELTMNRNDSDLGQLALKAAAEAARGTLYPFKILETDGGTAIWQGESFGYGPSYGGVSSLRSVKTSVSIRPSTLTITPSV
ncbi:hypothetical protein [Bradyrhizobium sp. URHD0069]|uniref:hypothetical protein n=1 Tax=Bradyrhizobium sp. URHD0069 TaxID=1380355 RepID=UPI00049644FF|nr:hypothetical protein [Bradyrhizobium sp. URHD0069]